YPPTRRRLMRHALTALPAALAVASALSAAPLDTAADDAKAVAALRDLGVILTHDESSPGRPAVAAALPQNPADVGAAFALRARLPQLREVAFDGVSLAEGDVDHLKKLKQMHTLRLSHTLLTDRDLEALAGLKELRVLDLSATMLTSKAQERVK